MYEIKQEKKDDWWDVESLLDLSFAPGREALSSYRPRDGILPVAELCLIARDLNGIIGGSIRFWPIQIGSKKAKALLLGPIAVHPTRQGEGVGGELIRSALELAKNDGWTRIVLIGDEIYYQKFGFKKSGFLSFPPPTNPDRLLYLELKSGAFKGVNGQIQKFE